MCEHCREEKFKESLEELKDVKGFNKIVKPLGDKPYEDLSGKKFGRLVAKKAVGRNKQSRVLWLCECECSNKTIVVASDLKYGSIKSCGCLSKLASTLRRENLEGKVFTRWTVIKDEGGLKVLCRCSCGTERWVDRGNLRGNVSQSCGCLRVEEAHNRLTKDLTGMVFGRLKVLGPAGRDDKNKKLLWKVRCSCGTEKILSGHSLVSDHIQSCGCLKREQTIERCTKPMIGKVFGRLTVLEKAYTKKGKGAYYKCQCSCGQVVTVQGTMLRSKNTRSCGCLGREMTSKRCFKDLTGQRFGKLVVERRADDIIQENGRHRVRFLCKCDCGGTIITTRDTLVAGEVMSCGCLQSKGEYLISRILSENNINFEKQKSYDDLRGKSKHGILRFDFYIIDKNYLIEYDGQHHFKAGGGWCSEEHVKETQERDKTKNEYCRKNSIPLIRIPYTHIDSVCLEDLKLETTKFRVI